MFEIFFTATVIILLTLLLVLEVARPVYLMLSALLVLTLGGILDVRDAFAGFSNLGMLTIAVLYIIATTLQSSGLFTRFIHSLLGRKNKRFMYLRFLLPVSVISAFINNTPLVATLIPQLKRWARKNDFPVSKLLIPLSYAAILGGMCTLIGTSTNLVIHGMLIDYGEKGFGFFEIGTIGLPVALIFILYLSFIGSRFLPEHKDMLTALSHTTREFVAEVKVEKSCPLIGKTIEEANLRHLKGLYLFQIARGREELAPLPPDEVLQLDDRLFFTGLPETIFDILKTPGFLLVKDPEFDLANLDSDKHRTFEAVISNGSPLVGCTVRDSGFRTKYQAVILAIHRNGQRINSKVGDIEFQANDTLFLLAKKGYEGKWYHSSDFALVSESVKEYSKPRAKGNLALVLIALMVISVVTGLISSMLLAASITAGLLLLLRIISYHDARNAVDLDVLLIIVAALGIGKAIDQSGLASLIASSVIKALHSLGTLGLIAGIFFLTSFYTELITNNAAAAILFPVVFSTAHKMGLPLQPLMIVLAIAASTSFATPIGYQTNLMVYSAGGYRFSDFLKSGLIINVMVGVVTSLLVYWIYF
ncbi:MAG: SLC13 family permease [Bacteroidales bacterium]|nr:SLC13 family permease [Bacteroidales bacterium]